MPRTALLLLTLLTAACVPTRDFPDVSLPDAAIPDAGHEVSGADVEDTAQDAAKDGAQVDAGPGQDVPDAVTLDAAADTTGAPDAAVDTADAAPDALDPQDVPAPQDVPDILDVQDVADVPPTVDMQDMQDMQATTDAGALDVPGGATNVDLIGVTWTCQAPAWQPQPCAPPVITDPPLQPGIHVDLPTPITYTDKPPSSGTHRPNWAKWGEYTYLPQQRWLHNLEHGGVAFLYHPCAPKATVDALRAVAKAQPADASGPFRWVLTPDPDLPSAVALVMWGHLYEAACVDPAAMATFIKSHAGTAPENVGMPGGYDVLWIGGWP